MQLWPGFTAADIQLDALTGAMELRSGLVSSVFRLSLSDLPVTHAEIQAGVFMKPFVCSIFGFTARTVFAAAALPMRTLLYNCRVTLQCCRTWLLTESVLHAVMEPSVRT